MQHRGAVEAGGALLARQSALHPRRAQQVLRHQQSQVLLLRREPHATLGVCHAQMGRGAAFNRIDFGDDHGEHPAAAAGRLHIAGEGGIVDRAGRSSTVIANPSCRCCRLSVFAGKALGLITVDVVVAVAEQLDRFAFGVTQDHGIGIEQVREPLGNLSPQRRVHCRLVHRRDRARKVRGVHVHGLSSIG